MEILIAKNYDEMSQKAFELIKAEIVKNPDATLGLATGSTPLGLYKIMVDDYAKNGTSYAKCRSVNLDEYVGLSADNEQSYAYFMNKNLFSQIDIDKNNTFLPDGMADDEEAECSRYDRIFFSHLPDVQLLGIGSNGHIGFNEPGTSFDSCTHVVRLSDSTIKDNSRLFDSVDLVPKKAFSVGIKNIMSAKKLIVLASGKNKAQAVLGMVRGEITPACPASILQSHPCVTLIVDEDAGTHIMKR